MATALAAGPRADVVCLDGGESAALQAVGEAWRVAGGPQAEHAARGECVAQSVDAALGVEIVVAVGGSARRDRCPTSSKMTS